MALVALNEPSSESQIVQWVLKSYNLSDHHFDHKSDLRIQIWNSLEVFDLPVEEGKMTDLDNKWTMSIRNANPYLRRRLFPIAAPDGHFPFMKLLVEIREWIFQYALLLPPSGVSIGCLAATAMTEAGYVRRETLTFHTIQGGYTKIFHPNFWWQEQGKSGHPFRRHLFEQDSFQVPARFFNLFHASSAFRNAAVPCFWSQNLFFALEPLALDFLLRRLPLVYRSRIENLGFHYTCKVMEWSSCASTEDPCYSCRDGGRSSPFDGLYQLNHCGLAGHLNRPHEPGLSFILIGLHQLPRLRRLVIDLPEGRANSSDTFASSGIRTIRGLREMEIHCCRNQEVERILKAEMTSPRDSCDDGVLERADDVSA